RARERLVERHVGVAVAADPPPGSDRLRHRLAESDADVLDRMVRIHGQIAARLDRQIDETVARHLLEHVLEEGETGLQARAPLAVESHGHGDARLLGLARDTGAALGHGRCSSGVVCEKWYHSRPASAVRNASFSEGVPTVTRRQPASAPPSSRFLTSTPAARSPACTSPARPDTRNSRKLVRLGQTSTPGRRASASCSRARSATIARHCALKACACSSANAALAWVRLLML